MDILIISVVAFLTSILTFFSGFGLGTILSPVFMIFFPVDISIALTGVVHFFNSVFKLFLVGRNADKKVLINFGIPAIIAALAGSWLLLHISELPGLFSYQLFGKTFFITPLKMIISVLLIFFALMDLLPYFKKWQFGKDKLIYGGLLSGFFGGLSGNQGALRSAFLIKSGLSKEAFIGTAVVISCFVDFTRLSVYASKFSESGLSENITLLISATLSAITGAVIGNKLLKKITIDTLQLTVASMLILISIALGFGFI